ncbi:MAG TPA: hypothetical protein VIG24_09905 [Acidimicrobiia bacterium]
MTYWENNQPVEVVQHTSDQEGEVSVSVAKLLTPTLWPSPADPMLRLDWVTPGEAAVASDQARVDLMHWIAGGGLAPVCVLQRVIIGIGEMWPSMLPGWVSDRMFSELSSSISVGDWLGPKLYAGNRRSVRAAMAKADGVLRLAYERTGKRPERRSISREVPVAESEREVELMAVAVLAERRLMRFLAAAPTAFGLVQRWYATAFELYKPVICGFSGEDIGWIFGQTRAAFHEVVKAVFTDEGERITGERIKVAGQKSAESSAAYAENARLHKPRQQLKGQAATPKRERVAMQRTMTYERTREAARRIEEGERKRAEQEAKEFEEMMKKQAAERRGRKR